MEEDAMEEHVNDTAEDKERSAQIEEIQEIDEELIQEDEMSVLSGMPVAHEFDEVKDTIEQILDQLGSNDGQMKEIKGVLSGIEKNISKLTHVAEGHQENLDYVGRSLEKLGQQDKLLSEASSALAISTEETFQQRVMYPIFVPLFRIYDIASEAAQRLARKEKEVQASVYLKTVADLILEILANHDIEPFRHKAGSKFNPKYMEAKKIVATGEKEKHLATEKTLKCGFRNRIKVFRHEIVSVYKCE